MTGTGGKKLEGALFDECAGWIWEQLQEEGVYISGEVVDLILATERELGVHDREPGEIARVLEEEFRMRGIVANPFALDAPLINRVLDWEDDFLGFAGLSRAGS